jgi:formyl-CoA transferase
MPSPLAGVAVIELGTMITAPLAAMMLADLGATITKIEAPQGGDPFRTFGNSSYSPNFIAFNRNKRSVKLDLRSDAGRRVLARLLQRSDVLLENYRPGVLERLGLGPEALRGINPAIIHCSITGFGATGPYSNRPAFDTVGVALSGIMSLQLDAKHPEVVGPTIADNVTGMYACYGVMAALYERVRTGIARRVEVNMLEASMAMIADFLVDAARTGRRQEPSSRAAASQAFAFRCADGKLLAIHLSRPDKFWKGLLAVIELPELAQNEKFATRAGRIANYQELAGVLAEAICKRPLEYWTARLEAADVPFAAIHSVAEVFQDPQVAHLGTLFETVHAEEGRVMNVRSPVRLDGERGQPTAAPTLGEHTDEVLAGLGYGADEIRAFRDAGVI